LFSTAVDILDLKTEIGRLDQERQEEENVRKRKEEELKELAAQYFTKFYCIRERESKGHT